MCGPCETIYSILATFPVKLPTVDDNQNRPTMVISVVIGVRDGGQGGGAVLLLPF